MANGKHNHPSQWQDIATLRERLEAHEHSDLAGAIAALADRVTALEANRPTPPFVLGTTKPDATNTGVPAGTPLTVVSGDQTYSTAGQVIENKQFEGHVYVTTTGVTFRNCAFLGPRNKNWASKYALLNLESATSTTVDRCTFAGDFPTFWNPGIKGKSMTVTRCDFSAVVDGIEIRGGDNIITGNYFHDFYFHAASTEQPGDKWNPPGWTHNDGIQWHASAPSPSHVVRGNNFEWYPGDGGVFDQNDVLDTGYLGDDGRGTAYKRPCVSAKTGRYQWGSALTLDCPSGAATVTGVDISENWISGGGVGFQCSATHGTHDWGKIRANLVDQDWYAGMDRAHWYAIRYSATHTPADTSSNYWMDVATVPEVDRGTPLTLGVNQGLENTG